MLHQRGVGVEEGVLQILVLRAHVAEEGPHRRVVPGGHVVGAVVASAGGGEAAAQAQLPHQRHAPDGSRADEEEPAHPEVVEPLKIDPSACSFVQAVVSRQSSDRASAASLQCYSTHLQLASQGLRQRVDELLGREGDYCQYFRRQIDGGPGQGAEDYVVAADSHDEDGFGQMVRGLRLPELPHQF